MKTILLIDDDPQIRLSFRLALKHGGYRVLEADSGFLGWEMAQKHLPDLILTDINMPEGNGHALLHHIRNHPELNSRQVVLMTGHPDVTPRRGMEDGADDFLMKPVSLEALLRCVKARLSRAEIHWRVEDRMLGKLGSALESTLPHEFFTPLAGIIGLADILRTTGTELPPNEAKELHEDIYHSALRLHRTLKNYLMILDLQNLSDETPPPLETVDRKTLGEQMAAAVAASVLRNDRAEDIRVEVEEGLSLLVYEADFNQLVEELVDNALKFSRGGTPLLVSLGRDGKLVVTDQGRGMTSEEIESVGAFRQFDRKKHEHQGLGLGLVLVHKLVNRCGAKLSIQSRPGEGTRVQIDFQLASAVKGSGTSC